MLAWRIDVKFLIEMIIVQLATIFSPIHFHIFVIIRLYLLLNFDYYSGQYNLMLVSSQKIGLTHASTSK